MLGQIFGTIILTIECLLAYVPDHFIDTIGLSFSYWVVKFLSPSCKVGAYVHYPFVRYTNPMLTDCYSLDMLSDIVNKKKRFNNSSRIADSPLLSSGKYYYYKVLIFLYGLMGNFVDYSWANSTWTCNHMRSLWPKWSGKVKQQQQIQIL